MYYESNSVKSVIFKPVVRDRQQMQLDRLETIAGSSIPYRSTFWNHPFSLMMLLICFISPNCATRNFLMFDVISIISIISSALKAILFWRSRWRHEKFHILLVSGCIFGGRDERMISVYICYWKIISLSH